MKRFRFLAALLALAVATPPAFASNHREAPITALDEKADITDLYAFVSYNGDDEESNDPEKVTLILNVDPLLEPGNGPTLFPFDPDILYEIKVDNDRDAKADVTFQFRFKNEYRLPEVYTAAAGYGDEGAKLASGDLKVPPRISSLENKEDNSGLGLNYSQTYTVHIVKENGEKVQIVNADGRPFYRLPGNAGPRTMDYPKLYEEATYKDTVLKEVGLNNLKKRGKKSKNNSKDNSFGSFLGSSTSGISVFCGTVDDPFFIDLGGAFDTANFKADSANSAANEAVLNFSFAGTGVAAVQSSETEAMRFNLAADTIRGFAVNSLALEVPIELLTRTGQIEPADSPDAVIGIWGTTSRPQVTVRDSKHSQQIFSFGKFQQIQRFGNPLINELVIGIADKDHFSMSHPKDDAQFEGVEEPNYFTNPRIAKIVEAIYNELIGEVLKTPDGARTDLLPLVQYPGENSGPIADLMRLNTGVPATPLSQASRLGAIPNAEGEPHDPAGYPNGRRLFDDVVDITLRVVVGGVLIPEFNTFPNNALGDNVNVDRGLKPDFPYLSDCASGRDGGHDNPGRPHLDDPKKRYLTPKDVDDIFNPPSN